MKSIVEKIVIWIFMAIVIIIFSIGFPIGGFCLGYYIAEPGWHDRGEHIQMGSAYYVRGYDGGWKQSMRPFRDEKKVRLGLTYALVATLIGGAIGAGILEICEN